MFLNGFCRLLIKGIPPLLTRGRFPVPASRMKAAFYKLSSPAGSRFAMLFFGVVLPGIVLTGIVLLASGCSQAYKNPHVSIHTRLGDIEVELFPDQAPRSVAAFLSYVDSGFYTNASFYRVLNEDNQPSGMPKSELIQGGIWKRNSARASSLPGIPHETTRQTHILHKDGVLSLARRAPGTATTEFFICVGDQPGFDYGGDNNPDGQGYAAFGRVVKGRDIVGMIYNRPEEDQSFTPPIDIFEIVRK
ncbi:MAG: peptidylprolyl isomerase [Puia sp.]|nr:peptidylprolyl isomerase [Puia sp.]